jgi:hypothetical protein
LLAVLKKMTPFESTATMKIYYMQQLCAPAME